MINISTECDLECCEAILLYLEYETNSKNIHKTGHTFSMMYDVINKLNKIYVPSMVDFTIYINEKYKFNYDMIDEDGGYQTFFYKQSIEMYKSVIREIKLNQIINV